MRSFSPGAVAIIALWQSTLLLSAVFYRRILRHFRDQFVISNRLRVVSLAPADEYGCPACVRVCSVTAIG